MVRIFCTVTAAQLVEPRGQQKDRPDSGGEPGSLSIAPSQGEARRETFERLPAQLVPKRESAASVRNCTQQQRALVRMVSAARGGRGHTDRRRQKDDARAGDNEENPVHWR